VVLPMWVEQRRQVEIVSPFARVVRMKPEWGLTTLLLVIAESPLIPASPIAPSPQRAFQAAGLLFLQSLIALPDKIEQVSRCARSGENCPIHLCEASTIVKWAGFGLAKIFWQIEHVEMMRPFEMSSWTNRPC
jgi:hypothetical protein